MVYIIFSSAVPYFQILGACVSLDHRQHVDALQHRALEPVQIGHIMLHDVFLAQPEARWPPRRTRTPRRQMLRSLFGLPVVGGGHQTAPDEFIVISLGVSNRASVVVACPNVISDKFLPLTLTDVLRRRAR